MTAVLIDLISSLYFQVRIFTYLIGREAAFADNLKWMACANKGQLTFYCKSIAFKAILLILSAYMVVSAYRYCASDVQSKRVFIFFKEKAYLSVTCKLKFLKHLNCLFLKFSSENKAQIQSICPIIAVITHSQLVCRLRMLCVSTVESVMVCKTPDILSLKELTA